MGKTQLDKDIRYGNPYIPEPWNLTFVHWSSPVPGIFVMLLSVTSLSECIHVGKEHRNAGSKWWLVAPSTSQLLHRPADGSIKDITTTTVSPTLCFKDRNIHSQVMSLCYHSYPLQQIVLYSFCNIQIYQVGPHTWNLYNVIWHLHLTKVAKNNIISLTLKVWEAEFKEASERMRLNSDLLNLKSVHNIINILWILVVEASQTAWLHKNKKSRWYIMIYNEWLSHIWEYLTCCIVMIKLELRDYRPVCLWIYLEQSPRKAFWRWYLEEVWGGWKGVWLHQSCRTGLKRQCYL